MLVELRNYTSTFTVKLPAAASAPAPLELRESSLPQARAYNCDARRSRTTRPFLG